VKPGDLVRIKCENKQLDGKFGTVVLNEEKLGVIYGLCVLIDGSIFGFDLDEVELIDEKRAKA
jgi:hypothetical protein|tara:strand:+ start:1188 stop:1376 length:189 start_codon:yes stop_codon:yes gene_type:complete